MFEKLLNYIMNPGSQPNEGAEHSEFSAISLNTALLMIDIAGSDQDLAEKELSLIRHFLGQEFCLSETDVGRLLDEARQTLNLQSDLWEPIRQLNRHLSGPEKINLLTKLWRIVFADGRLDGHEDHLMHKIADLLKLDHDELIQTKLLARQS